MKKLILVFGLVVFALSMVWGDIFITELADPNNETGARYVEIYNSGASAVDLSTGYDLIRWTNGNLDPTLSSKIELSGTIASGGFYVVCNNQTTFTATYEFAADQNGGTGGPADSNGDDQIALRNPSDEIIDMFGVVGEDGSGTNHEFEDGRAERKATVTTGNTTYTFAEWNIWNDTGGSGTTQDPQDAPADFDPGAWIGPAGSDTSVQFSTSSASVSEGVGSYDLTITINNEDAGNATTCDVVLTVGDAADINSYTTQGVTFPAGSSANQNVTVTVTDDGTYEGDETLTFEIQNVAGGNNATVGSNNEFNLTIEDNDPATTGIPYSETFDSDLGACYTYSVSGATKEWEWSGGSAYMSGYNSGDTEEDWLILPGFDADSYSNEVLTFDSWYNYGTDDVNNYLKLYYSIDYSGIGNPSESTWNELAFTQPESSSSWESSGNVDLSAISGSSVWIAFKYHYESGSYRNWQVDNLSLTEGILYSLELTSPNGGESWEQDSSNDIIWNYNGYTGAALVDIEARYNYNEFGGYTGTTIATVELNTGSFTWNIDTTQALFDDYKVFISITEGAESSDDISDAYFSIVEPTVVPDFVIINEVDADQTGTDADEFIELYDGGVGNTALDGLVVVLFNGSDDASYQAIDLDGYTTDAEGYFVIGSATVPNVDYAYFTTNGLQNGADAVALYEGNADDFPNDTPVTATNLFDAIVYDTNDGDDTGLLDVLLNPGEPQVNEASSDSSIHSSQRIPNGTGGGMNTSAYVQLSPTPGVENVAPTYTLYTINQLQSENHENENVETTGIVTAVFSGLFTIQDGAGVFNGIWISSSEVVAQGDDVTITGMCVESNDLTMINVDSIVINSSGNSLPNASVLTTGNVNQEDYEGVLVNTSGACDNPDLGNGEWSIDDGITRTSCRIDDLGYVASPTLGNEYDVTGVLNYSYGNFKIEPRDENDVIETVVGDHFITVLEPNGGESYEIGSTATITWNYGNFTVPGNVKVDILNNDIYAFTLIESTPNDGEGSGLIPDQEALIGDLYKVSITSIEEPTVSDESDDFFSIIAPLEMPDLIISEVADPGDDYLGRFVELYNADDSEIDFSVYTIYFDRQANGDGHSSILLTGTIAVGETYVIGNASNIDAIYGAGTTDLDFGSVTGNGNDGYFLFYEGDETTGTLMDAYGVIDVDGTGEAWEYENSRAVRNADVTTPNPIWTASEWTITAADLVDMTPGTHPDDTSLPAPTNVQISHDGTNVTITWDAIDGATGYIVYISTDPYAADPWTVGTGVLDMTTDPEHPTWTETTTTGEKYFYKVTATN